MTRFRLPFYTWLCWLGQLLALALLATPYRDATYPIAVACYLVQFSTFVWLTSPKHHLRLPFICQGQTFSVTLIAAAGAGLASWGNPWLAAVFALISTLSLRFVLFRWMAYTRFIWFDAGIMLAIVAVFVVGVLESTNTMIALLATGPLMPMLLLGGVMLTKRQLEMRRVGTGSAAVGEEAPGFTLESHRGETISLADFRGVRPVLLFFVRGDWCPGCHIMLRAYERNRRRFEDKNTAVLAIGPDPTHVNREMVETLRLEFGLLSDERHTTAKKYRVLLEGPPSGTPYEEGLPLPASFLIDVDGVIRFTSRAESGDMLLHPEAIFPVLERLPDGSISASSKKPRSVEGS